MSLPATPLSNARRRPQHTFGRVANQDTSADTSPIEDSGDDVVVASSTARKVKEVSIPTMARLSTSKKPAAKALDSTSPTDSTLSSMRSSPRADSVDYDTPGTTPATSVKGATLAKRKRSTLGRNVLKIEDTDEESDEALARRLQKEEYEDEEIVPIKRQKTSRVKIEDTEDEESQLSEPESMSSLNTELVHKPGKKSSGLQHELEKSHNGKQVMAPVPAPAKGKKVSLPARIARTSARQSIGETLKMKVEDSEMSELDDLSEVDSEDDFIEEESEAVSTGVSDAESEALDTAPTVTSALPARRTKVRRTHSSGRRRFGRITAERAQEMAEQIEEAVMSRKDRERKKLEKAHPNIKTMWDELEAIPVIELVPAAQPASISRKLKTFQLEGLDWMTKQEKTHYRGGLLGDEMGMGKTIQAVSLIMSDYPQKEPTLVVVPPVALMQWSTEIKDYTDGKLKVLVYHGQNSKVKGMSVKDLKTFDVIMISYNSLESLYRKETKGWTRGEDTLVKEDSPIHAIHFHRLILDEAHSIKSRTTGVAKACFALTGTYKWCLSGTPVQNRIGEFFSLLRFLEVRPFADYFCKRCPCSMLHWKLDEEHVCTNKSCKHTGMEHVSVFNQELLNPITQSEEPAVRKAAMNKLHMITARIMLRRMKRDYVSSMELPPKEVIVHNEFFGEIERDFSSSIMSNTARTFDTYVSRGVMLNNYVSLPPSFRGSIVLTDSFAGQHLRLDHADASSRQPSRSHPQETCCRRAERPRL